MPLSRGERRNSSVRTSLSASHRDAAYRVRRDRRRVQECFEPSCTARSDVLFCRGSAGHKILEFAIQRLDCYRAGCNCDERSCKLRAEGDTGVGKCSNVVSGLKFVANGDVDPCPPHVLLKDGNAASGSGTAGHIFLTVLPPVSGEVVCEFLRSASVIAAALFFSYSSTRSVKVCCRSTSARRACSKGFRLVVLGESSVRKGL